MKAELEELRSALTRVIELYPPDEAEDGSPIRQPHECMLRNFLRSLAPDGPIEAELRAAIMAAYSKEIA